MSLISTHPIVKQRWYFANKGSRRAPFQRHSARALNSVSSIRLQPQDISLSKQLPQQRDIRKRFAQRGLSPFDYYINIPFARYAEEYARQQQRVEKKTEEKKPIAFEGKKPDKTLKELPPEEQYKYLKNYLKMLDMLHPRNKEVFHADKNPIIGDLLDEQELFAQVVEFSKQYDQVMKQWKELGLKPDNFGKIDEDLHWLHLQDMNLEQYEGKRFRLKKRHQVKKNKKRSTSSIPFPETYITIPESVRQEDLRKYFKYVVLQTILDEAEKTGELNTRHPNYVFSVAREILRGKNPDDPWLHIKRADGTVLRTLTWDARERLLHEIAEKEMKTQQEVNAKEEKEWEDEIKAKEAKRKNDAEAKKLLAKEMRKKQDETKQRRASALLEREIKRQLIAKQKENSRKEDEETKEWLESAIRRKAESEAKRIAAIQQRELDHKEEEETKEWLESEEARKAAQTKVARKRAAARKKAEEAMRKLREKAFRISLNPRNPDYSEALALLKAQEERKKRDEAMKRIFRRYDRRKENRPVKRGRNEEQDIVYKPEFKRVPVGPGYMELGPIPPTKWRKYLWTDW